MDSFRTSTRRWRDTTSDQDDSFNSSRAETFEALGHPTRIKILQVLSERPLTFTELKRAVGIESNGLLAFHLGKLKDLARLNAEGNYALTDEGKEALRVVDESKRELVQSTGARQPLHMPRQKAILAVLVIGLVALGSIAVYQQAQINGISHVSSGPPNSTVLVYGTIGLIQTGTHATQISFASTITPITSYSAYPNANGQYWVMLPANKSYITTVYYEGQVNGTCNQQVCTGTPITLSFTGTAPSTSCSSSGCPAATLGQTFSITGVVQGNFSLVSLKCVTGSWELHSNSTAFNYNPSC